jgi:hypothetical protein
MFALTLLLYHWSSPAHQVGLLSLITLVLAAAATAAAGNHVALATVALALLPRSTTGR